MSTRQVHIPSMPVFRLTDRLFQSHPSRRLRFVVIFERADFNQSRSLRAAAIVYEIPSADSAGMSPEGNRFVLCFDESGSVTLSALHVTAIEKLSSSKNATG